MSQGKVMKLTALRQKRPLFDQTVMGFWTYNIFFFLESMSLYSCPSCACPVLEHHGAPSSPPVSPNGIINCDTCGGWGGAWVFGFCSKSGTIIFGRSSQIGAFVCPRGAFASAWVLEAQAKQKNGKGEEAKERGRE